MVNGDHNDDRPDMIIDAVVQFIKDKFDEQEKVQKSLPETLDSKSEEKEEQFSPISPKLEDVEVETGG